MDTPSILFVHDEVMVNDALFELIKNDFPNTLWLRSVGDTITAIEKSTYDLVILPIVMGCNEEDWVMLSPINTTTVDNSLRQYLIYQYNSGSRLNTGIFLYYAIKKIYPKIDILIVSTQDPNYEPVYSFRKQEKVPYLRKLFMYEELKMVIIQRLIRGPVGA